MYSLTSAIRTPTKCHSIKVITRIERLSQYLGSVASSKLIHSLLHSISPDSDSGQNALVPDSLPIEVSFSESAPETIRFDWEPFETSLSPEKRLEQSTTEISRLIEQYLSYDVRTSFEHVSNSWRSQVDSAFHKFGAFLGAAIDSKGIKELKIYYECNGEFPCSSLIEDQDSVIDVLKRSLPHCQPHGVSLACNNREFRSRHYFLHYSALDITSLQPVFQALELDQLFPASVAQIHALFGQVSFIPYPTVLGLSPGCDGYELKLEWLLPRSTDINQYFFNRLHHIFWEKPDTSQAFSRWIHGLTNEGAERIGQINAVGFRVNKTTSPRFTVYVSPVPSYAHEVD